MERSLLSYMALIAQYRPKVLVSDFNMAACLAAIFSGTPLVFVTERYDFTLCQLSDEDLREGGFEVDCGDLARARAALHMQFGWMIEHARLVLTDKPYIAELDDGTPVAAALAAGHAHFVGPMIRDIGQSDGAKVRAELGLGDAPFIVASISGTTMFSENKEALLQGYLEAYDLLRQQFPALKMVLLGRQVMADHEGVICKPYYPDWMGLLRETSLLMSAPGWITVTEIAAMRIPTFFVLPSKSEYHEAEALDRLQRLGFATYLGCDGVMIAELAARELQRKPDAAGFYQAHERISSPDGQGAARAAAMIVDLIR